MSLLKPLLMSHSLFWIYCIRNIFPPKSNGMSSRHYLWWRWTWDKRCDLWHLKHSCQPPSYQPIVTTCAHISASPSFHSKEGPIPNPCTEVSVAATRTRSPILTEITGISGQSRAGFMVWAEYEEVVVGYTVVHLPPWWKSTHSGGPKFCRSSQLHLLHSMPILDGATLHFIIVHNSFCRGWQMAIAMVLWFIYNESWHNSSTKQNIATGETSQVITSRHYSSLLFTSMSILTSLALINWKANTIHIHISNNSTFPFISLHFILSLLRIINWKANIATGETSWAIASSHILNYFHYFHFFDYLH